MWIMGTSNSFWSHYNLFNIVSKTFKGHFEVLVIYLGCWAHQKNCSTQFWKHVINLITLNYVFLKKTHLPYVLETNLFGNFNRIYFSASVGRKKINFNSKLLVHQQTKYVWKPLLNIHSISLSIKINAYTIAASNIFFRKEIWWEQETKCWTQVY